MNDIEPNPDLSKLQDFINDLLFEKIDCIIGFGGGSAIDSAKAFSLALSPFINKSSLKDLIYDNSDISIKSGLPLYAVPTTSGTGAEVTSFATIWDHREHRKLSLTTPAIYPHSAYVDPALTDSLPYDFTLNAGLDAINQAAESIWNKNMSPMSEIYAHRSLKISTNVLPSLLKELQNDKLRDKMSEASLFAGLAISHTRTSLCHSISYPITAHLDVPHGLACAFTMSAVLRHNLVADDGRFKRLIENLVPNSNGDSKELIKFFEELCGELNVSDRVKDKVISLELLMNLEHEMIQKDRADNSLVSVQGNEIKEILKSSWNI
jgi:alcohol dehydrogenase